MGTSASQPRYSWNRRHDSVPTPQVGYSYGPTGRNRANRLWDTTDIVDPRLCPELEFVGGVPYDELEWEDGMEAPIRPTIRRSGEWETPELVLANDPWELESEHEHRVVAQSMAQMKREQEARDRQAAKEAHEAEIRRYARIKYARKQARRNAAMASIRARQS